MNKYKNMLFFDADAGGGEGGGGESGTGGPAASGGDVGLTKGDAAFEPIPKSTTGERPLPGEKPASSGTKGAETEEGKGDEGTPATTGTPAPFDPNEFAKTFGSTLTEQLKPILQQKVQDKEMTPEEARKLLKTWEPDENWYKTFDNLETRNDAVLQMRDSLITQADTLAQIRLQQAIDGLKSEFEPHFKAVQEANDRQREERFQGNYPQLKNPALKPLIESVTESLVKEGQKFKTEPEMFKAIADRVEAVLKVTNPEFKLETATNGSGQQKTEDRGGRQLPVTTPGGGGGTGRREGGESAPTKKGLAIFGK